MRTFFAWSVIGISFAAFSECLRRADGQVSGVRSLQVGASVCDCLLKNIESETLEHEEE